MISCKHKHSMVSNRVFGKIANCALPTSIHTLVCLYVIILTTIAGTPNSHAINCNTVILCCAAFCFVISFTMCYTQLIFLGNISLPPTPLVLSVGCLASKRMHPVCFFLALNVVDLFLFTFPFVTLMQTIEISIVCRH